MARGIEGRKIFKDDKDRKSFLERLSLILEETQTQCFAWALIPNHFHLLMRTGPTPLSKVMRRLMTGYAVTFNKRHKRSGHLFQNRYKSIVCEEDPYLLELIRYIHLNPLRAKLVQDLKELDKYQWCGHSAILGKRSNPLIPDNKDKLDRPNKPNRPDRPDKPLAEKTIEDVLFHFADTLNVARRRYRQFIRNGIDQGTRPEFQGGGLVRSAGGDKWGLLGRKKEDREKGDERILGSGAFVEEILKESDEAYEIANRGRISVDELIRKVVANVDLDLADLTSPKRNRKVSNARAVISYLAVNQLGFSASEVARKLGISGMAVGKCVDRGKETLDKSEIMREYLS
jgi:putative transposase